MCLKWADGKEAGTSEAADGPGVDDDVLGLEAQAVDGKLDHHIHGIGLILRERHSLQEEGQSQDCVSTKGQLTCPSQRGPLLQPPMTDREGVEGRDGRRGCSFQKTDVYNEIHFHLSCQPPTVGMGAWLPILPSQPPSPQLSGEWEALQEIHSPSPPSNG